MTTDVSPEIQDRLIAQGFTAEQLEAAARHLVRKRAYMQPYNKTPKVKAYMQHYNRDYYQEHKQEMDAAISEWRRKHPQAVKSINALAVRKWKQLHPERYRAYMHNRRDAEGEWTGEEWITKLVEYDDHCAYCGIQAEDTPEGMLVPDHSIPIARGGKNTISNIVPACTRCNHRKGTKTSNEFCVYLSTEAEEVRLQ